MENCIPNSINTLTIPYSELESFSIEYKCNFSDFKEINKYDWSGLNKEREGIPYYFGLIALQCHAAYLMQNDGQITVSNYKKRFADLVGLKSSDNLESIFSEEIISPISDKIQEVIWFKTKEHLQKRKYLIGLPEKRSGAGRYIQYPKEQVVLNYQDLKEYIVLLQDLSQKKEDEVLSFENFKIILQNEFHKYIKVFKRENNLKSDSCLSDAEKQIKYKQIFDYYNTKDWSTEIKIQNNQKEALVEKYYLKLDEFDFQLYDQNFEEMNNNSSNNLIGKHKYLVFEKHPIYNNDFESIKSFSLENQNIVLIYNSPNNRSKINELDCVYNKILDYTEAKNILVYDLDPTKTVPSFLDQSIIKAYPISLIGYKISGVKKYFSTSPPKIISKNDIPFVVYYRNCRVSANQINQAGIYTIKVNGYTNYNFELIDPPNLEFVCNFKDKSLSFLSLDFVQELEGHMLGLNIKCTEQEIKEELTINNWIKSLSGQKINSKNPFLKAISQKHYGKNQ